MIKQTTIVVIGALRVKIIYSLDDCHGIIKTYVERQWLFHRNSGSVVESPLCDREVAGSIPCRVIPKTLKMVLAALSLGAQH